MIINSFSQSAFRYVLFTFQDGRLKSGTVKKMSVCKKFTNMAVSPKRLRIDPYNYIWAKSSPAALSNGGDHIGIC